MLQILPVGFAAPYRQIEDLSIHNVCLTAPQSSKVDPASAVGESSSSQTDSTSCVSFELEWKSLSEAVHYNIWMAWSDAQALSVENDRTPWSSGVSARESCCKYLGRSVLERFKVVNLAIPSHSTHLTVAVQAVNVLCKAESVEHARRVTIPVR